MENKEIALKIRQNYPQEKWEDIIAKKIYDKYQRTAVARLLGVEQFPYLVPVEIGCCGGQKLIADGVVHVLPENKDVYKLRRAHLDFRFPIFVPEEFPLCSGYVTD